MPYDYERSVISKATGLTGVEAGHIAKALKDLDVDPQTIDWEGAISDARDYGGRYQAVKNYIRNYYGVSLEKPDLIGEAQFDMQQLENQAATKQGVKKLLRDYYTTDVKGKKDKIKEMLLTETPLYNVLMSAMYNGTDLPLARKFLNEAMQAEVLGLATPMPVKQPPSRESVADLTKELIAMKKTTPAAPPKIKKNGNGKPIRYSVDIDRLLAELQKPKPQAVRNGVQPSMQPGSKEEKQYLDQLKQKIIKEGQLWKKLLTKGRKPSDPTEALKLEVKRIQLANMPLQLRLEREKLLMRRQQMQQIQGYLKQQQRRSSVREAFSILGFFPSQPEPLYRPGYMIETRPKLPPGFRYVKMPKGRKTKQKTTVDTKKLICPRCNLPLVVMPNFMGQPMLVCPRCGAT